MTINDKKKVDEKFDHLHDEANSGFTFNEDTTNENNDDSKMTSRNDRQQNDLISSSGAFFDMIKLKAPMKESYASISSHSNTEEVSVQTIEYLYIVTELCHEHTLYDRLLPENRQKDEINRIRGLEIFYQIVKGMAYIHKHVNKLIHRDLKPKNIFFSLSDDRIKIGDFGLAKMIMTDDNDEYDLLDNNNHAVVSQAANRKLNYSITNPARGTPSYRSPEQQNNEQPTQKVDIYAMGLILLELLYSFSTESERKEV
ncbi:unnamed protein product [Rotaria sp. Silwood2]|nr:unnamed protein product [Rotaria sp. Silwood2]CAF3407864.1 unnamed protein product [Rotaria sp. Silwood2]CAF4523535.1 unnamed protein product [Rotaria sp. Silwood2]CAF4532494.1 unnamed protein product [Rotaria sp. Silwood2]CAF4611973.1 unnamed protein product [Rotaria sp. Silwood2]